MVEKALDLFPEHTQSLTLKSNLDDGRWTCTCELPGAGSPYCQVAANVNSQGKITGWECLTHGCATAPCEELPVLPERFYPCTCP